MSAVHSFATNLSDHELTCESGFNSQQYFGFAVSVAAAAGTAVFGYHKAMKNGWPQSLQSLYLLQALGYVAQATALWTHNVIAQNVAYLLFGAAMLMRVELLSRASLSESAYQWMVTLSNAFAFIAGGVIVTLNVNYNPATLTLTLFPPAVIGMFMLYAWRFSSQTTAKGMDTFLMTRLLAGGIAFTFWALDLWFCNETTAKFTYGLYVFFYGYFLFDLDKYVNYVAAEAMHHQASFTNGIFADVTFEAKTVQTYAGVGGGAAPVFNS